MSSGPELANQIRQSRTSIVFLLISAASIYYSTQIQLEHGRILWNLPIAGVGVVFFLISMWMMYKDRKHETEYRDLVRRSKSAEVETSEAELEELKKQQEMEAQEEPASVQKEGEEMPREKEWS